jgi:hypothetical protein
MSIHLRVSYHPLNLQLLLQERCLQTNRFAELRKELITALRSVAELFSDTVKPTDGAVSTTYMLQK